MMLFVCKSSCKKLKLIFSSILSADKEKNSGVGGQDKKCSEVKMLSVFFD